MKNPFGQIVSFEDYVDIIGIPKEQLNSEEVKNRINKWLVQATEQFDSMISGNGQLGRLYRWFEKLEDNEEDNYKKYKLIKAICSWVETFVIKGKFWVDGLPVINSNVDIQINSSSNDSNVEAKRKDIIQDLVSVGLYQTTNFGDNNTFQDNQQNAEQLIEDLIVLSTSELQQNYLRLNPQKSLEGNLDFANNDLVNGGNIIGSTQHARNNIQYYNIIDSTIDLNRNTIIGSLGQDPTTAADIAQINQNIANINQEQITQNTNISNNANEINTIKAKDQQQDAAIQSNTTSINANTNSITTLTQEVNTNKNNITNLATVQNQHDQLIQANTNKIQTNTNTITSLDGRLVSVSGLLTQTIDGLRTYKPFQYVGDYQNGTSYNINQLVSYNNNLYLSKEDNNNTTPPSDKWLLINKDTVSVDLSDYPTKLEVEAIKNNLQQSITSNTTNITDLQNNVVKLTTDQTINGTKTFNSRIVANEGLTTGTTKSITSCNLELGFGDGTAYITPEDNSNKTLKFGGRSGRGRFNLDLENQSQLMGIKDPTADYHAANKKYVDNLNNQNVKLTGDQSIGGNKTFTQEINVPTPTTDTNAATKAYVDNAIQNITPGSGGSIDTSNFATLNTNQTISGQKTFSNAIQITKTTAALQFKPGTNQSGYLEFYNGNTRIAHFGKGSSSNNNLTLAAQSGKLSIEASRGTEIHNPIQFGTEIKAGFGGLNVKFIPEDNSTKTLQFYNNNATDQRRFNLLVPEPTQANNPATKNYVDNAIAGINTSGNVPQQTLNQINNNTSNITTLQGTVNTNTTNITNLQTKANDNAARITTNAQNIASHNSSIVDLQTRTIELETNSLDIYKSTEQVIEGPITFRQSVSAPASPLRASDLTNKQYVDNQISQIPVYNEYNLIYTSTDTLNNLQKKSINISNNTLQNKSFMIQFDRKGNNGSKYEGTFYYNFLLPGINQATWVGSGFWYNSATQRFDTAANVGITILRTNTSTLQLTIQCWDGGNRISNIKLFAPK